MARDPHSVDELLDLIDHAIFEMDELVVCAGEDLDDELVDLSLTFRSIAHALRTLQDNVRQGQHQFADGADLPFMRLVRTYRHVIPFSQLLDTINRAHRSGFVTNQS